MSRIVLITGCSSGFGLLSAVEFAKCGDTVVATMRNLEKRGALDAACAAAGVTVEAISLDVTDEASVDRAVQHVIEHHGQVDVLVNNAGYGVGGFVEDLSLQEYRDQFDTNFFGAVAATKAVIPYMRAQGSGRIINVSSMAGRMGQPVVSAYVASKWALEGFSESLRHEMRPYGVYVVLVEPGGYPTAIFDDNLRVAEAGNAADSPNVDTSALLMRRVQKSMARSKRDPRDVARVIVRAATRRRPRMRYLVGRDAKGAIWGRAALPFSVYERIVGAVFRQMQRTR